MDEKICVTHAGFHILHPSSWVPVLHPFAPTFVDRLVTRRKHTFVESFIVFIHEQRRRNSCSFCCAFIRLPFAVRFVVVVFIFARRAFAIVARLRYHLSQHFCAFFGFLPVVLFSPECCDSLFCYLLKLLTLWQSLKPWLLEEIEFCARK